MELGYAAADLVLSRSGAMTCAELAAVGLPAVYVPYPHSNQEQQRNALPVVEAGGGLMVDDKLMTPEWIEKNIIDLARDPQRLAAMGAAAARYGRRDGDEALRQFVLEVLANEFPAHADAPANRSRTRASALTAEQLGTVHLIGIGGVGMSGLARLLLTRGIRVTGSELREWPALASLRRWAPPST